MENIENYKSILNQNDPISGADNQLPIGDLGEKTFVHRIFPYRFYNNDIAGFGKANTTLVIGISNKKFDKELTDNLRVDSLGNPFFNINVGFNLTSKFEVNRYRNSYTVNIVNVETFDGTTSEYFTTKSMVIDPVTNLLVVDKSHMMCFTIDEPFDENKVATERQSVYFISNYYSNLDDESMKQVNDNKDVIFEDQFNISMNFINSYTFATQLHNLKFAFTTLDLRTLKSNDFTTELVTNNYSLINKLDVKTTRKGYFNNRIEDIKLNVKSDLVPLKTFPTENSDNLNMKAEWLDYNFLSPLNFIYRLYPRYTTSTGGHSKGAPVGTPKFDVNGKPTGDYDPWDSNSGGSIANMFLEDDGTGTNTPTFVQHGKLALKALADMVNMSTLINDSFSDLPLIGDTTSVNYGSIDPITKIGYSAKGLGTLNKGASTKISLVDKFYFDFIIKNNITPDLPIWKLFHCAIVLLNQYISSQAAISEGLNKFGNIFAPWYLEFKDIIQTQNWKNYETATTGEQGTRFNIVFPGGMGRKKGDTSDSYDPSGQTVTGEKIDFFIDKPFWNSPVGKVFVKSEWFKVNQPNSVSNPQVNFSIEPFQKHKKIGELQIKQSQGTVIFPLVGDNAIPINRSAIPGDISTNDNTDLAYMCWINLPKTPQVLGEPFEKFDKFFQKEASYTTTAGKKKITVDRIKFFRGDKTNGVFPQSDSEKREFVLNILSKQYRVPKSKILNLNFSNHTYMKDTSSTKEVGFYWTSWREWTHGPAPDHTKFLKLSPTKTGVKKVGDKSVDPNFQNTHIFHANKFPTIKVVDPAHYQQDTLNIVSLDLRSWINEACHTTAPGSMTVADLTLAQQKVFIANYFDLDYTDHAADPSTPTDDRLAFLIEPYTGSNIEKGDPNPGIRGKWYDAFKETNKHWGGHFQFNMVPLIYLFRNVTFEIDVPITIMGINDKIIHFDKELWLDTRVHDYSIPLAQSKMEIIPSKYVDDYAGISEIITKGFFIDHLELHVTGVGHTTPKIIKLPLAQDLDDGITTHRFTFI